MVDAGAADGLSEGLRFPENGSNLKLNPLIWLPKIPEPAQARYRLITGCRTYVFVKSWLQLHPTRCKLVEKEGE